MEDYFKYFFIGYFLTLIIVVSIISYFGQSLIAMIIGVLMFGSIILFLDVKYLPKRKTELANKLIEVFKAERVSEGVMKFKIGPLDFYAEIMVDFKLAISQIANFEIVKFHVPRNLVDQLSIKPRFKLKEDKINEIPTYYVYQTDGTGLKLAKKKIGKIV